MITLTVARSSGTLSLIKVSVARARCSVTRARRSSSWISPILADAYVGFNTLYEPDRKAIKEAGCWADARRKLFELADIASKACNQKPNTVSPVAFEAVQAAVMLTLIQTAKLNDVDSQAWLPDVLAPIAHHQTTDLAALLPWNWRRSLPVNRAACRGRSAAPPRSLARTRSFVGHGHGHGAGARPPLDLRHRRPADRRLPPMGWNTAGDAPRAQT